jgi:putative CocE/NonD family hydrolase
VTAIVERTDFPRETHVLDPVWIPLSDGTRLCARIWLPVDAEADPVPAILEYLPYRKDDVHAADDAMMHPYFAGHGYAAVRVDIRGSGDSDGVLLDEYHVQEQDDALEVIAWIARQPWCTGAVGMMGISWSGFNSLQVAARRPPALKAIITACSTDDRYDNDVHYYGGLPLGYYLMPWASVMLAFNARPPDPAIVGDRWRELWRERLDGNVPLIDTWLGHQNRDDYWRGGSIREDYGAIECGVLAVGGWADAYTDAIFRMLEHLDAPTRALVGPWGHMWPNLGIPGPAIGFFQHAVRWWDHWLKGEANGIMDEEPALRAWMQDGAGPHDHEERPGRWVAEPAWPPADAAQRELALPLRADGTLGPAPDAAAARVEHSSELTVGLDAGAWCAYGNAGDLPTDQRRDDAVSLTFDSGPLTERLELLGLPQVALTVTADRATAFVMARLCDVAPDGSSTVITRGALNLCQRDGRDAPRAIVPGEPMDVAFPLKAVGYAIEPGHRVRLALSTSYWPWLWPSPEPVTIGVATGPGSTSALKLPARAPQPAVDNALPAFGPPEIAPRLAVEQLRPRRPRLEVQREVLQGATTLVMARDFTGARRYPSGLEYHDEDPITFSITDGDPLSARVECRRRIEIRREGWETAIEVVAVMTADAEHYHVSSVIDAYEGDTRIHTAAYTNAIPRDHT